MSIHYYFSWFSEGFPDCVIKKLNDDISLRKLLVMISGSPSDPFESDLLAKSWFNKGNIFFDEYEIINYKSDKNKTNEIIKNASVIFLCGGYPSLQNDFLIEYNLIDSIKVSDAIIMGASAGAMNMSSKWLSSKNTSQNVSKSSIISGIGMDSIYFCTKENQSINDTQLLEELLPLSNEIDIYMAIDEVAIRIEDGIDISGEVYCISKGIIKKLKSTF
ncbi:cyanophycinase [Miniphocaeibacter massiliensis]|uniref:cyanophycinase n=1 Tax=Miniphocaeibacter massiliensis TaxID=2041841 RepID=UPI000C07FE30|nr:cyanophycinase [Miniphocaeibacter massiliensis]